MVVLVMSERKKLRRGNWSLHCGRSPERDGIGHPVDNALLREWQMKR